MRREAKVFVLAVFLEILDGDFSCLHTRSDIIGVILLFGSMSSYNE